MFCAKIPAMEEKEFLKLYDENVAAIFRYIFLRVNSKETAQDLASEVFLRAWKHWSDAREGVIKTENNSLTAVIPEIKNSRAFLYRIAKNLTIDFYRRKLRTEISLEDMTIQIPNLKDDPAAEISRELELEPIKKALAEMKDDHAEVIIWHYLDELTIIEIAEILDKSEGAVRVMLSRALEKVRKLLG